MAGQAAPTSCTWLHLALLQGVEDLGKLGIAGPCFWAVKQLCGSALHSFALIFRALGFYIREGFGLSWAPLLL